MADSTVVPHPPPVEILSVSPVLDDHAALRRLCRESAFLIVTARTCDEASRRLQQGRISIVVCETDLPDGTWRNILADIQVDPEKPCLIVTSTSADETLWAEVLNLGGFDLLPKPFHVREARHVLETACLRRVGR